MHPAIKQVLCEQAGTDRAWLARSDQGGGTTTISMCASPAQEVIRTARPSHLCLVVMARHRARRLVQEARQAEPQSPGTAPTKPPLTLDDLPSQCRTVLAYGQNKPNGDFARRKPQNGRRISRLVHHHPTLTQLIEAILVGLEKEHREFGYPIAIHRSRKFSSADQFRAAGNYGNLGTIRLEIVFMRALDKGRAYEWRRKRPKCQQRPGRSQQDMRSTFP